MKTKMIVAAMALFMTMGLSAQTPQKVGQGNNRQGKCYVDANNNNICDNYENATCTHNGCGKGAGLCDGSGRKKNGKGMRQCQGKRDGSGRANGGRGANFVDENNNGICDNKE